MKVIHVDPGIESVAHVTEFCKALGLPYDGQTDHIFEERKETACNIIRSNIHQLVVLIAHREPSVADVGAIPFNERPYVIRIGISRESPVLRLTNRFVDRIAELNWPEASGSGLGQLGYVLHSRLAGGETPENILTVIYEYLVDEWISDDRIAAYLLRVVSSSEDQYRAEVRQLGLDNKFEEMTREQLLAYLGERLPGARQ